MIVVAASLGGPVLVGRVLARLPEDFPASVLVVQHRAPVSEDRLTTVLRARASLPVHAARSGRPLTTAGITVLPARHTATVDPAGALRLRPSSDFRVADPLISSVAEYCGRRTLCVVLTGRLDDAAAGVRTLKRYGGRTIVQDPAAAQAPGMPLAALATGCVDLVMPVPHIAPALITLTMAPGAADLFRVPPSPWADLAA